MREENFVDFCETTESHFNFAMPWPGHGVLDTTCCSRNHFKMAPRLKFLPDALSRTLLEFQQEGVLFGISKNGR